jgi:class 3 adenylate cyclase/tetratricopeptide (TPR) repeat protein
LDCQRCGATNDATSRFCDNCGSPLTAACPTCGQPNRPGARFCNNCGSALAAVSTAANASPLVAGTPPGRQPDHSGAERRLVTVVFADLVGFTPFSEDRDPEAVRELLSAYFDATRLVIERHGGTVEKFIGDAVMAAWGTPIAHEDDAERAVRAALGIVDAVRGLGASLEARVGVLTGDAAVTLGATNEGMVAGDMVNTAARLQSAAPPGTVLVGESTMRAASAAIAFEAAGEQALKGKATPVPAWIALRVIADRGGQNRTEALEPPFVGRDEELRQLKELLHATGRERRARFVSVTGPAGIGKSRLAWELEKYVDGVVESVYWHRGRSPAYGEGITFWALGEMVRRRAGLAESDDEATTRERLLAMVADYVPDDADRRWVEPAVQALLGLAPPPAGGRDVLFAAWRILFERVAARGTTVLLFEDVHWADSGLLDFIDHLVTNAKGVPILVITLARPELFDRHPGWGSAFRNATSMTLEALPEPAMRELLDGLAPGLPEPYVRSILERAEGIPLYAVETVRSLMADGRLERVDGVLRATGDLGEPVVPETLRSLVASRLDGLDPVDRGLVLDGAVLGHTFTVTALAAVSGLPVDELEPRLRGLVRRELIEFEADPTSPERGQYGFVQGLIREVAYGTLARRDRRARHLAVARHFEATGDIEVAGVLATHYLAAHAASAEGPEADAVAAQARIALRAASDRAADLGSRDQAMTYIEQALAITTEPVERAALLERLAASATLAARYDAAMSAARDAIAIHRTAGDTSGVARVSGLLGSIQIDAGQVDEAIATIEPALAELPSDGTEPLRADLESRLSRAHMRLGRFREAVAAADRALDIAERHRLETVVAEALVNKGSALAGTGRWREGVADLRAAVELAERSGDIGLELRARNNMASTLGADDPIRANALALEAIEVARRVGDLGHLAWMTQAVTWGAISIGRDWDARLADIDGLLEQVSGLDRGRLLAPKIGMLVERGEPVAEIMDEAMALIATSSDPDARAMPHHFAGWQAFLAGDPTLAYRELATATGLASQSLGVASSEAAYVAAWMRDPSAFRDALEALEAVESNDRETAGARLAMRAAAAMFEGDATAAAAGFREAFEEFGAYDYTRASMQVLAVRLTPNDRDARRWADEARVVFERCRSRPLLELLDEAVTQIPDLRAPGGSEALAERQAVT